MNEPLDTSTILDSISDGVFTVDSSWKISSFNRAAELITGIDRIEAIGQPCSEVFRSSMCGTGCALQQTIDSGSPIISRGCYFIRSDGETIPVTVSTAILRDSEGNVIGGAETFRDLSELESLKQMLASQNRSVGRIVSKSPIMESVIGLITVAAPTNSTILITGETGTGKEVSARAVHELSDRSSSPFVAINCAAIPETLLESELFGHEKGAFTGATSKKIGLFSRAGTGTLFLDEIGDITPTLQVKLLRVLQEREFVPVGGSVAIKSRARIVAATNRDLPDLVEQGIFRQDLYYRLKVIQIELPALRHRREDIPLLAEQFLTRFRPNESIRFTPDSLAILESYRWPGNIRELENAIEYASIVCGSGPIELIHLPAELRGTAVSRTGDSLKSIRDEVTADRIKTALAACNGNRNKAAKLLGIHKTTLFRRMKQFGIS